MRPLVGQRVFVRALGYEDLNDHDTLRHDPILAVLAGKLTPRRKDCAPVAGKSTLNRLELSRDEPSRYHKIGHDPAAIEELWVDLFIEAHARAPKQIILDLDATDDPLHGDQEGRFFHAYYGGYCYLPLYVFCGRHLLAAKLRRSNLDAAAGAVAEIARIVAPIRRRWPRVRILLRADSGFCREDLMAWCEVHAVDYLFGLARCSAWRATTGSPPRSPPRSSPRSSPSWRRRKPRPGAPASPPAASRTSPGPLATVGAAPAASSPRWSGPEARPIRASSSPRPPARSARAQNRIKECPLDLFADRTSSNTLRANQLRRWFAAMAYVLMAALRRIGLSHTQFARATCGTIRLKLLKIGARVTKSVRRIKIAMASACPYVHEFARAHACLAQAAR